MTSLLFFIKKHNLNLEYSEGKEKITHLEKDKKIM